MNKEGIASDICRKKTHESITLPEDDHHMCVVYRGARPGLFQPFFQPETGIPVSMDLRAHRADTRIPIAKDLHAHRVGPLKTTGRALRKDRVELSETALISAMDRVVNFSVGHQKYQSQDVRQNCFFCGKKCWKGRFSNTCPIGRKVVVGNAFFDEVLHRSWAGIENLPSQFSIGRYAIKRGMHIFSKDKK